MGLDWMGIIAESDDTRVCLVHVSAANSSIERGDSVSTSETRFL